MSQEPTFERYVRDLAAAMQQQGSRAGQISPEPAVSGTRETGATTAGAGGDMSQQDPRFIGGLLAGLGSVISSPAGQQVIAQLPGLLSSMFGGRRELEEISSSDIVQQDPRFIGGLLSCLPPLINSPIGQQVMAQLPTILGGLFHRRRDLEVAQQDPRFIGGLLAGLGSVISSPMGQQVIAQLPGLLSSVFGGRRELEEISSSDVAQQDPRFIGGLLAGLGSVISSPIGQQVIAHVPSLLGSLFRRRRDLEVAQQDPRFLNGVLSCLPSLNKLPGGQQIIGQAILGGCFGSGKREETIQGGRSIG